MIATRFATGEEGEAVGFDGSVVELVCVGAYAPGQPVELVVLLPDGPLALRGKSRGSRRREDGRFDVRLRPGALRREERERLETAFARPARPRAS